MTETATGKVLSEVKYDGVIYKNGESLKAPKATIKRLIRIGVVEDPSVKAAADKEANAGTAAAEAKAKAILEDAKAEAGKVAEEADEKARTVTEEAIAEADKLVADAKAEAEKIVKDAQEAAKANQTNKPATASK